MSELDYSAAGVDVRDDLTESHARVWEHVGSPGTWWTGEERVAIASETRNASGCALCRLRKAALSPSAIDGEHESDRKLAANVVDVIHRVVTDPARLSKPWFDSVLADGLSEPEYVELIGVVTLVVGVDYFARALGVPPLTLPEPLAGEPTRQGANSATHDGAWVPMVPQEAGASEGLYEGIDGVANVHRALSLVPEQARALRRFQIAQYLPTEQVADLSLRRDLDRAQMELVAARVSALNECFY